jgi:hypothetical protein
MTGGAANGETDEGCRMDVQVVDCDGALYD